MKPELKHRQRFCFGQRSAVVILCDAFIFHPELLRFSVIQLVLIAIIISRLAKCFPALNETNKLIFIQILYPSPFLDHRCLYTAFAGCTNTTADFSHRLSALQTMMLPYNFLFLQNATFSRTGGVTSSSSTLLFHFTIALANTTLPLPPKNFDKFSG